MNDNTFILFCNFESFVYFILKKKNENFFNKLIHKDEHFRRFFSRYSLFVLETQGSDFIIRNSSETTQTRSSSSFSSLANGSFLVKSTICGRHLTEFAETLHKAWDMKKKYPGTRTVHISSSKKRHFIHTGLEME